MKRILMALLAMTMVFGATFVAGCSKADDGGAAEPTTEETAPAPEGGAEG